MKSVILFVVLAMLTTVCRSEPGFAKEDVIRRDTNDDGKVDQVAHLDNKGNLVQFEIDSNTDGIMDRFQFYEDGEIIRLERDATGGKYV